MNLVRVGREALGLPLMIHECCGFAMADRRSLVGLIGPGSALDALRPRSCVLMAFSASTFYWLSTMSVSISGGLAGWQPEGPWTDDRRKLGRHWRVAGMWGGFSTMQAEISVATPQWYAKSWANGPNAMQVGSRVQVVVLVRAGLYLGRADPHMAPFSEGRLLDCLARAPFPSSST